MLYPLSYGGSSAAGRQGYAQRLAGSIRPSDDGSGPPGELAFGP
jgi:hypothetical protein